MKERPILFNAEMVRALLDGGKWQTRRVLKPQPNNPRKTFDEGIWAEDKLRESVTRYFACPYGMPGDRLWVRETFQCLHDSEGKQSNAFENTIPRTGHHVIYAATDPKPPGSAFHWKPSIFMPRWASRITLEVVKVRVERVQSISEEDALAEGVTVKPSASIASIVAGNTPGPAQFEYYALWESINAKRGFGWDKNPRVWVVEFKRI